MKVKSILLKTLGAFMALAMLLAMLPAGDVAAAGPWFVRTDGSDTTCDGLADAAAGGGGSCAFLTIAKAITEATAGDTIYVGPGNYPTVGVNKSISIHGANAGIHPAVGTHETASVETRGPETVLGGLTPSADNITVDGIHFLKAGTRMIDTYADANNFTMRNCIVESTLYGATTGVVQFGGGSHTNMLIEFNLFIDKGASTFYAGGGPYDGMTFQYNKFQGANRSIFWAATPLVDGVIKGNEFDGEGGTKSNTINIGHAGNLQLSDNWFHDNYYTAVQVGVINGSITGNTFEKSYPYPGYGARDIELWGGLYDTAVSTNVTISGNTFFYNDIPGAADPSHGLRLTAPASGADGIDASTIHVFNNAFYDGGARTDAFAIRHNGDQTTYVDADMNYWGSASPDFDGLFSGPVNYTPWCGDAACTFTLPAETVWVDDDLVCGGNSPCFETIQEGINEVVAGGTVNVAAGEYVEVGQIVIEKDLTIIGEDKATTIIKPAQNTGSTGDPRGWFLVNAGVEFNLSNVTLDGSGKQVHQAIRSLGSGTIDNNIIQNIYYSKTIGLGVAVMGNYNMTISNNTFSNIERIGMMAYGSGVTDAQIIGNTYTGKGDGDYLDYGIEIGGGAKAYIEGNTITGIGESTTAWSSAAILVTDAYPTNGPAEVVIVDNDLSGNYRGIHVGYGDSDRVIVKAELNNLADTYRAIYTTTDLVNLVDGSPNWFGSIFGPNNQIVGNVTYTPWCGDEECSFLMPEGQEVVLQGAITETIVINNPGLTIFVKDGTVIDAGRPCFEVYADNTTIYTESPGGTVCSPGSHGVIVGDGVDSFELTGLEIDGTGMTPGNGVHFEGAVTNVWLVNNFIHDIDGHGVFFTEGLGGTVNYIQGNLFLNNAGNGIEAGTYAINAQYNAWGHVDGATAGDGASENVDWANWTHADLYLESSGTVYPNQVVKDDEIVYTVYGNLANIQGVEFTLTLPTEVSYVADSFKNLVFDMGGVTVDAGNLEIYGYQYSLSVPTSSVNVKNTALFSFTLSGDVFGKELEIGYVDENSSFAHVQIDGGPTNHVYATQLLGIDDLEVTDLPVLSQVGLDDPLTAGIEREFEVTLENTIYGGAFDPVLIYFFIADAELDDVFNFECYDETYGWLSGLLSEDTEGNLIGQWGPPGGFELTVPYTETTQCRVTFMSPGEYDVLITLVDLDTEWELARLEKTVVVNAGGFSVIGTVSMQGRTVRSGVPMTLFSEIYGPFNTTSGTTITNNLVFSALNGGTYLITTNQARYLNITAALMKTIYVDGNIELPPLHLFGGNAVWTDNIINILDASTVGGEYGWTGDTVGQNADVNFDGKVNIQDLALVGGNFDLTSQAAYADWIPSQYNGDVAGQILTDAGVVTGTLTGDFNLTITGQVTSYDANIATFSGTVSGDIIGNVTATINAQGIDTLYGYITETGTDQTVRIIGAFVQSGVDGDFVGEIIAGPELDPVTSLAITGDSSVAVGSSIQLVAEMTPPGRQVFWSVYVNHASIAEIDENGLLTGLSAGSATVIVKTYDDSNLSFVTKTITVTAP